MTPNQVQKQYLTIRNKIDRLNDQLDELQEQCQHPNVEKTYKGNTGNYDPSADSYWIEWLCPDCKKYWMTDQ